MLPVETIIIFTIGILAMLVFLVFFIKSKKYDALFVSLDEKEYPLKEVYSVGYAFMEFIKYDYKSDYDRKKRTELEIVFDKRYTEFYLRVAYAQKVTYTMLMILLAFIFYGITSEMTMFIFFLGLAAFAYYYYGESVSRQIQKRSEEILSDFAEAISKLALLTNAGLVLKEAWELVADSSEGILYEEMRNTKNDMQNGMSDSEAIHKFGLRCMIPEVKKFSSTVVQGLERGNSDLSLLLKEQSTQLWDTRKQIVKREGEKASSKLMLPIMLMFVGILIMVIVPIFTNLGV